MKKAFLIACLGVLLFAKLNASCLGLYLRGMGGVNFLEIPRNGNERFQTKRGCVWGGSLGLKLIELIRVEGEFAYRQNPLHQLVIGKSVKIPLSGTVYQLTGFGNLFLDIPLNRIIYPYIGGGIGYRYSRYTTKIEGSYQSLNRKISEIESPVYQGIVGLNFYFYSMVDIRVDYRCLGRWDSGALRNHAMAVTMGLSF